MTTKYISREEFLQLNTYEVAEYVAPHELSISLLLNGTRRAFIAEHFDNPPADFGYLKACLEDILVNMSRILAMLAEHGIYRVFLPSYSEDQVNGRHDEAYKSLIYGLKSLTRHPALTQVYSDYDYEVHFYGDMSYLPDDMLDNMAHPPQFYNDDPQFHVYYGIDGGNPHEYILKLAYLFSVAEKRPPNWEDMLKLYYGSSDIRPLNILVAFNRIYARLGIPPLLDGQDRIYATPVSPLKITQTALREILYDYIFNTQDRSRSYIDIHPDEIQRLKQFYDSNKDTVIGLTKRYDDLVYPISNLKWPNIMNDS